MTQAQPRGARRRPRERTPSRRRRAPRSRRGGSAPRPSSSRSRPRTWRRCPHRGRRVLRHAAVPPPATAARQGGPRPGPPRARPASRCRAAARSPSSRAGSSSTARPPCRSPSALLAAAAGGGAAAPRGGGGRGDHAAGRGHRSGERHRAARRSCSRPSATQRMAEYLARRGPAGARMMRQTAAFQVALDLDDEPWLRWRVLNAAAPYVVAIFANSPIYDGRGHGLRQRPGAGLARARPGAHRPALGERGRRSTPTSTSRSRLRRSCSRPSAASICRSASGWRALTSTLDEWHDHLTTLFPEVRPRGHFELRSADAVAPQWYAAPLALAVGITYEPRRAPRRRRSARRARSRPCSTGRAVWVCATRRSRAPRPTWCRSRSRAARGSGPGTSIPPIWSRRGHSSSSTPGARGPRVTTSPRRRWRRRGRTERGRTTDCDRRRRTTDEAR